MVPARPQLPYNLVSACALLCVLTETAGLALTLPMLQRIGQYDKLLGLNSVRELNPAIQSITYSLDAQLSQASSSLRQTRLYDPTCAGNSSTSSYLAGWMLYECRSACTS